MVGMMDIVDMLYIVGMIGIVEVLDMVGYGEYVLIWLIWLMWLWILFEDHMMFNYFGLLDLFVGLDLRSCDLFLQPDSHSNCH